MPTPIVNPGDSGQRSEIPLPEMEGHIIWGEPFTINPAMIEGAEHLTEPINVYPEVVNLYDDQRRILTLKLAHRLDKPIKDHITGEMTDRVLLGSFGQNDPVRMWFASIYTGEILEGYIETAMRQAKAIQKDENAKPRLNELLYQPFNIAYITRPRSAYSLPEDANPTITWPEALPDEVIAEIAERIKNNEPLNYQYLGYLVSGEQIGGIANQPWAGTVLERMNDEQDITRRIKKQERDAILKAHNEVMQKFGDMDFTVTDGSNYYMELLEFEFAQFTNFKDRFVSDIPEINVTTSIINHLLGILELHSPYIGKPTELPFIADHIREQFVRRVYEHLGLSEKMTLGQFASAVYQLRFNDQDPNLLRYETYSGDAYDDVEYNRFDPFDGDYDLE